MKNLIIGILLGALLGVTAGFALGIFAFPYLFPPPPLNEQLTGLETGNRVATGRFIHADPNDPLHHGRGGVTVYENLVRLETDFEVGPGPKYHLYLVPDAKVTPATAVAETMFVDLGRLKAFSGSQNYVLPTGVDPGTYGSVVVWCEQFGVLISPAALNAQP